jgi:diketogulonate reductase-like aldo/keto reductase
MLSYCRGQQIVPQAYSPLTRGKRLKDQRLAAIARRHFSALKKLDYV